MANAARSKKNQNPESSNPTKAETTQNPLFKAINDNLPNMPQGLLNIYNQIQESENKIASLDDQINEIKDKLKPISKIDRNRGKRRGVVKSEANFLKASKKRLEKQRFIESDNWSAKMKEFREMVGNDVSKVRDELSLVKARSLRYVTRNKQLILRKTTKLLDEVMRSPNLLINLKKELQNKDPKIVSEAIKYFLEVNEKEQFLYTAYISHESIRSDYDKLMILLLDRWTPKVKGFVFSTIQVEFKITRIGIKR